MELSDEAKELIKDHCDAILKEHEDTIREMSIYKMASRAFFTIVLGGTILGIFKAQDYLDDRILKGTQNLERLIFSRSLADADQAQDALKELLDFAQTASSSSSTNPSNRASNLYGDLGTASQQTRVYFFLSLLDTLSSIPAPDPEAASFGKSEWEALQANTRFLIDIMNDPRWIHDPRVLNRLGLATVKFAPSAERAERAKYYFTQQAKYARSNEDIAASSFCLAMLSLINDETTMTSRFFLEANKAMPGWVKRSDDYFSSNDQYYYTRFFQDGSFRKKYAEALRLMNRSYAGK